jgi:hypothetical protein
VKPAPTPPAGWEDISRAHHPRRSGPSQHGPENTAVSHHSQSICQCLQTMVILLEELENKSRAIDPTALDSAMAYHKEALTQCNDMLHCARCSARSEYMMLLTVVCEKLVALCEKALHQYLEHIVQSPKRPGENSSRQRIFLGDYEIDLTHEWEYLIKMLIVFQLRSLGRLLGKMKTQASSAIRGSQLQLLLATERRLRKMTVSLQRSQYQKRPGSADGSRSIE